MIRYHVTATDIDRLKGFIAEISTINDVVVKYVLYAIDENGNGDEHVPLINGSLKWDGCSDTSFENTIHFCGGLDDWMIFDEAVKFMFNKADEILHFNMEKANHHGREFDPWKKDEEYTLIIQEYKGEIKIQEEN